MDASAKADPSHRKRRGSRIHSHRRIRGTRIRDTLRLELSDLPGCRLQPTYELTRRAVMMCPVRRHTEKHGRRHRRGHYRTTRRPIHSRSLPDGYTRYRALTPPAPDRKHFLCNPRTKRCKEIELRNQGSAMRSWPCENSSARPVFTQPGSKPEPHPNGRMSDSLGCGH
jgi:hypothetical protein